jgi:serine/threonine-protein kinase
VATGLADQLQSIVGNGYQLVRELESGGMSRLFLANERALGREVVIKVLPPEWASETSGARFEREIAVSATLQHPNILSVLDAGSSDGIHYYVTPFVRGQSLRKLLQDGRRLPLKDALRILGELSDAVDYAHRQGVIHRDIKPENVLLADGHAVLADFGVALAVDPGTVERLTRSGISVGTVGYMPPEQLAGARDVGPAADVFSLAAVGYELLTGRAPFTRSTIQQSLAAYFAAAPTPPQTLNPEVPFNASEAILRGLSLEPDARQTSARQFADQAVGRTFERPTSRRWRISRRALLLMGAGAAGAVGLVTWRIHGAAAPPTLADNIVAVAPFDVIGADISLWREGLLDVLARNLDGAGVLRVVSPTRIVRLWRHTGASSEADAVSLGRAVGARFVVLGSLLHAGPDSVRLSMSVVDGQTRRTIGGPREWRDLADRIDRMADSASLEVMRAVGTIRPVGAVRRAFFNATSFAALREFLAGEQFYRRSSWDSAATHFRAAVALDTAFALALWRMGLTLSWQRTVADTLSWSSLLRAGSHNRGLAPRESLLVAADSIRAAVTRDGRFDAWADIRRLFVTLEEAVRQYPGDAEAWWALGDAQYHFGYAGTNVAEARVFEALSRSITLDSAFAPPYAHTIELALALFSPDSAKRVASHMLRRYGGSTDDEILGAQAALELLDATDSGAVWRTLSRLSPASAGTAWLLTRRSRDSLEVGVLAARFLASHAGDAVNRVMDPLAGQRQLLLGLQLAYRGHFREAAITLPSGSNRFFSMLALNGAVPDTSARRLFDEWTRTRSPLTRFALPWWYAHGDSSSIASLLRSANVALASNASNAQARYDRDAALAYLSLLRHDSTGASRQFAALVDSACQACGRDRLIRAQLQLAMGDASSAGELLGRRPPGLLNLDEIPAFAILGLVLERMGRVPEACLAYGAVVDGWRNADSSAARVLNDARAGLERIRRRRTPQPCVVNSVVDSAEVIQGGLMRTSRERASAPALHQDAMAAHPPVTDPQRGQSNSRGSHVHHLSLTRDARRPLRDFRRVSSRRRRPVR